MANKFLAAAELTNTSRAVTCIHWGFDYTEASATFQLKVKAGTIVHLVTAIVTQLFDGSPTLAIQDTDANNGWLASTDIAPGTAGNTAASPAHVRSVDKAQVYSKGKMYVVDSTIDFVWVKGTSPTGGVIKGYVYLSQPINDGLTAALTTL